MTARSVRQFVRSLHRYPLGMAAQRARLRLRHDVLAARLRDWNNAGVWQRLHEVLLAELRAAGKLDLSRAIVDSSHVRALKGGPNRSESGRPRPAGLQAPPHHRRRRCPTRGAAHRRQPQRHHLAHPAGARDTADPRQTRTASQQTAEGLRRPRLRPRQVPRPGSPPGYHACDRSAGNRTRLRTGHHALGRRAELRVAALVPPPTHALGNPRRHPPKPCSSSAAP